MDYVRGGAIRGCCKRYRRDAWYSAHFSHLENFASTSLSGVAVTKVTAGTTLKKWTGLARVGRISADAMVTLLRLRIVVLLLFLLFTIGLSNCASSTPTVAGRQGKPEPGFFERLTDQLTERECNVARFTCPYGFGAAGEPCDCTDPRGVVLFGRTIK